MKGCCCSSGFHTLFICARIDKNTPLTLVSTQLMHSSPPPARVKLKVTGRHFVTVLYFVFIRAEIVFELIWSSKGTKHFPFRHLLYKNPEKHCVLKVPGAPVFSAVATRHTVCGSVSQGLTPHLVIHGTLTCHIDLAFHHLKSNIT